MLLKNTFVQAESLLHCLEQLRSIGLYINSDKTKFMCFKQNGAISVLNDKTLKFIDQFIYFGSNISFTKSDVIICIGKLMYWCTTWAVTKPREKAWWELHKNATCCFEKFLEAAPHKSAAVQSPLISQNIQVWTRYTGNYWRSQNELLHMDTPVVVDQQRLTHISSVQSQDAI